MGLWGDMLRQKCKKGGIVLDIGANAGIFGLWAARQGCLAIMFEPQVQSIILILYSIRVHCTHVRTAAHVQPLDRESYLQERAVPQ
jgi:hypothetical protein